MTTLQGDWTGLLFLVSTGLLSTFILLFLLSFSVSLSNFYLAAPMCGCLGKHSCMSSPFPIAILNGTCSLRALMLFCGDVPAIKTKLNKPSSAVSLSYFILAVPMCDCLGRHQCVNSPFYIAILNGTCFLRSPGIDFVLVGECY